MGLGRVGVPTRLRFIFSGIFGYDGFMKTLNHLAAFDSSQLAKLRLQALEFKRQFGLKATLVAYQISKATFYRWKKTYERSQRCLTSLIPQSTRPKRVRKRQVDPKILGRIKELRLSYGALGKDKLKPILDNYCFKEGIKPISASTIGRIVSTNQCFYQRSHRIYHNPNHKMGKSRLELKRLRQKHAPKPTSLGHLEMDSLVQLVDGMKVYLITAIDVKLKFAFALTYTRLNSQAALDCFKKLQLVYPFEIKSIQTDNGLEFLGDFHSYLNTKKIIHKFTYPRCPRINGVIERFNRTLKEDFLQPNLYLVNQPKLFHRKLMEYLLFFNTQRPHQSLGQISPLGYALKEGYLSQMCWTSTMNV
jgi:transposase InsO family protein